MEKDISSVSGKDRLSVAAQASLIGSDLLVCVHGGERPHLGAVAMAFPCQSGETGVQAYASVISAPGHRDDVLAHRLALGMCKVIRRTVCMTVGIHVDHASEDDIRELSANAEEVIRQLTDILKEQCHGS